MAWLRGLIGSGRASDPDGGRAAERCLSAAGWQPGRARDITSTEQALRQAGFRLHDAGHQFLGEYHGLRVDVPVAGAEGITGLVHFAPEMALRLLGPDDLPRLAALMPASACPVGTAGGHTVFVFMDDQGRSYLLDMEWSLCGELAGSPAETLLALCDGRNGRVDSRVLDDQGRPTGEVIRAAAEQRHWGLDQFPTLAPFLPAVSLSPLRRPPTWSAMVRAAEQALPRGRPPGGLVVSFGGFIRGPSGECYFVAHGENCLYVRSRAGFRVLPPPPGIPSEVGVGEVIPFQPPYGW